MFTGEQLANYCLQVFAAKWVYWYGTYGKKCTKKLYDSKRRQYPSHYGDSRTAGYMKDIAEGKSCADCVGMIKSFFWKNGDLDAEPKYATNHCPDVARPPGARRERTASGAARKPLRSGFAETSAV